MSSSGESRPFRSAQARDRYLAYYDALEAATPIAWETRMLPTGFGDTLVRSTGPADGTPLVLLPPASSHSLDWSPSIIEALARGHRTHVVDSIYDFGMSVSSRPVKTSADVMGWLDGLLDALGLPDAVDVMGCSLGAWIAAEYTLHAPQRLGKVIWLSPGGVVLPMSARYMLQGLFLMPALMLAPLSAMRAQMRWLMPDYADSPEFEAWVEGVVLGQRCFSNRFPYVQGQTRVFRDDELRGIGVPVLYLAGETERIAPVDAAVRRLASVAPRIQAAVIPGVGHDLAIVRADEVAAEVLRFLDGDRG